MAIACTTSAPGARRRNAVVVAAIAAASLAVVVLAAAFAPSAEAGSKSPSAGYPWPVKPFHKPHPVRGSFGDPRTLFRSPPTARNLMSSHGSFSFHQGVDISAPNGSAVYPVRDGVVSKVSREWLRVDSGGGSAFEYWHVGAVVTVGQRVTASATVLGHVIKPAAHVHLTELADGRPTNPLAPGHLTPYRDDTRPEITSVGIREPRSGRTILPHFVRGRVTLLATAEDMPATAVPGIWNSLPVTPAQLTFRIQTWTGKPVIAEQTTYDVRERVPAPNRFWRTYARGTYQNMAVFGPHYSFLQRGNYLFDLGGGSFDTKRLKDGVYDLVVTATDIAGNSSTKSLRFTVHNRPGWVGS